MTLKTRESRLRTRLAERVLQSLESRRLLDATLDPARFLLGDTDRAPVNGSESEVQIAAGNGGYLAVWTDRRSILGTERSAPLNYGWPGGGTDTDIFGVRLDSAGKAIGASFAIYQGARADSVPQVDFNGTNYLVSWLSVPADDQYGRMIQAARVSPQGIVLDTAPILVEQNGPDNSVGASIAYNFSMTHDSAGNWLTVFGGWLNAENSVMGRRISPAGVVLDSTSKQLIAGDSASGGAFFHDGRFVVASYAGFSPVRLRSFTPSLNFVAQTTINHAGQVASNGNDLYMVWSDNVGTSTDMATFGSRVSDAGALLGTPAQLVATHPYSPEAKVTWDGTNWQAVTVRASYTALVTHVSPTGAVINAGGTVIADSPQSFYGFATASKAGTTVATLVDRSIAPAGQDITSVALLADNTVSPRAVISLAARNQMNVDLATGPGGFMSVYKDLASGRQRILAQRLDTAGHSVSNEPIVISDAPDYIWSPKIAFNGEVYMVVWYQQAGNPLTGVATGTYMRRLDIDGQPLDAAPVFVATQYGPDVAAVGNQFLIASHYSNAYSGYTQWYRYNSAGQRVSTQIMNYVGAHTLKQLEVLAVGDRWLVLTENHYQYDPVGFLNLAWIDAAGIQSPAFNISIGQGRAYAPHIATSGNNVLMVYDHKTDGSYQDVWGVIIGLDSSVGMPFKIGVNGTADSSQSEAHVAWNGNEYVAAWVDHRNKPYPLVPEGDIYAARISESGVVLDPDGVAVASSGAPDDAPTVHFGHGITLLGYSTFNPALDAGAMRVAVREIFSPLAVERSEYRYQSQPAFEIDFNADVSASFSAGDIALQNVGTGQPIDPAGLQLSFDRWSDAISIAYVPAGDGPSAALPDGDYRLTLAAGSIGGVTGVPLTTDLTLEFFVLAGDANRDRSVDFDDLITLAANYNQSNRTFAEGDFDYSGTVDFADLLVLASRYNQTLAARPPIPGSVVAPAPRGAPYDDERKGPPANDVLA